MTDVTIAARARALGFPEKVRLTTTTLTIVGDLDIDEWASMVARLEVFGHSWQWWYGDAIREGEMRYGEKHSQMAGVLDSNPQTLTNVASVVAKYAPEQRHAGLSFTHHAAVAYMDDQDARERLLTQAEEEGWSVVDLRDARNRLNGSAPAAGKPTVNGSIQQPDLERPSDEPGIPPEPEPRDELAAANRQIEELATELTNASEEIDELSRIVESMEADDKAREIATWVRKYGQLEGRLNQMQRTLTEATNQAKWRGKLLKEVRDVLGVERDREIVPRLMELTGVRAAS